MNIKRKKIFAQSFLFSVFSLYHIISFPASDLTEGILPNTIWRPPGKVLAQTPIPVPTQTNIPDINRCENIITDETISQFGLTNPSFWWTNKRFGGQLVDGWLVCRNERQLNLIVNRQIWTLLDYLERYEFVHQFGTTARDYGYNVRVLNQQQIPLASYTCNHSITPSNCNLWIDNFGRQGLRTRLVPDGK